MIQDSGLGRQPRTFGGQPNNQQPQQNNGYQGTQNPSYNYALKLAQQIAANSRTMTPHGQGSDPNEGFQGFSYNKGKTEGLFGGMFNDSQVLSDEQYRLDAIDQATQQSGVLYNFLHNRMGAYYAATKDAMEQFKRNQTGGIEPVFEPFITEVENNLQLYRYMASMTCALFACDLVSLVMSGTIGDLNNNVKRQMGLIRGNFLDVVCLQYSSWLEGHPEGMDILNSMTPMNRKILDRIDTMIEAIQNKLLTISTGNVVFPFPWKKGFIKRMVERTQVKNTLLDDYDFNNGDRSHGMASSYFAPHDRQKGGVDSVIEQLYNRRANNPFVEAASQSMTFGTTDIELQTYKDDWGKQVDQKEFYAGKINRHNRMEFNPWDYFIRIPNAETELYVIDPKYLRYFSAVLQLRTEEEFKVEYWRVWKMVDVVPVVRLDWENGYYDYTNVALKDIDVGSILTNPDKVLPFLSKDQAQVATEIFEGYVTETNYLVDGDKKPITIPECKKLGDEPKVVFGNRPFNVTTNEEVIGGMASLSDYYDPNSELDAFILPYRSQKLFQMENCDKTETVYEALPDLVTGRCNSETINDFIRGIRSGLQKFQGTELETLVRHHLTNVVNRWLVECRFYPENKEERGYIKLTDLLDDHEKFLEFIKEMDKPTANAYYNLTKNQFLRENLTLFAPKETAEKFVKHELEKYKDELLEVKTKLMESAVLIEREFMLVRVNPMKPLSGYDQVVLAKSGYPALDFVYEQTKFKMEKHFSRIVPMLVTFGSDANGRIWVATKSEFDNGVYSFRPVSTMTNIQLLNIAK